MSHIYHMQELLAAFSLGMNPEQILASYTEDLAHNAIELLDCFLETPSPQSLLELEQSLMHKSLAVSSKITALAICLIHRNTNQVRQMVHQVQHQTPGKNYRQMGQRDTRIRLSDGSYLKLTSPYLASQKVGPGRPKGVGRRGPAGSGSYPVLESLGIQHQATPGLLSEVAKASVRLASFEEAKESLAERGCLLDEKTVRRLALAVGHQALEQRTERLQAAENGEQVSDEFAGKRVVIGTDGGRLRLRVKKQGRRRQSGHHGYETPWREPKLVVAYVVDEKGRLDGDHIPRYDATMGDADDAFELLLAELKLRGASDALELCVVGDGARWIWNRVDELIKGLGLEQEQVVRVADFYHVSERLSELSQIPKGWSGGERKQWYKKMRSLVWKGRISEVLRACRLLQKGRRSAAIGEHLKYLENLRENMQYDVYRKQGWPCGSGAVESAMRRVVNLRLKGPGIFWKEESAEAMLHLRSYQKAGRWEELMMRVLNHSLDGKSPWSEEFQVEPLENVA